MKPSSLLALVLLLASGTALAEGPAAPRAHETLAAGETVPGASLYQLEARLTDSAGRTVGLDTFRGQPTLISLFYGRCPMACPMLIASIKRIEASLPPEVRTRTRVLLVSMDPANDTPEVLASLTQAHRLDAGRWKLTRTSEESVQEIAAVLGVRYRKLASGAINHSTVVTLLDPAGNMVARVDGVNAPADALVERLKALASAPHARR